MVKKEPNRIIQTVFDIHDLILHYVKVFFILFLMIFGSFIVWKFFIKVSSFMDVFLINQQKQLILKQEEMKFKINSDNTANSNIDVVTKKDLEKAVNGISIDILHRIKELNGHVVSLHTAVVDFMDERSGVVATETNKNEWELKNDPKIWIRFTRKLDNSGIFDYHINNKFKFDLVEAEYGKNNIMKFTMSVKDEITGKRYPPETFESKIDRNSFLKRRVDRRGIMFGMELSSNLNPAVKVGYDYGSWTYYGKYNPNRVDGQFSVGVDYHVDLSDIFVNMSGWFSKK